MNDRFDPCGPAWLEQALVAWADRHELSDRRAQTIVYAVVQDAAPELPFEWWQTIFPILRLPKSA